MTTNNLIAFRVDAGVAMGLGHLSRCLTLAKVLHERGTRILFLISPDTAIWVDMIRKHEFDCQILDVGDKVEPAGHLAHSSWLRWGQAVDVDACRSQLTETPAWLVVDHYALDKTWEAAIKPWVERLMVIDDLADREHFCDALLDQNLKAPTSYEHLVSRACEILIGPRYALLRAEFAEARPAERSGGATRINIFMGGTDSEGATVRVLDDLAGNVPWEKLDVILGAKCPHLDAVRQRVDRLPDAELHVDSDRVARLFAFADIGIGAGGVAALERCCVGLPSIGICVADNQAAGLAALVELGAVESLASLPDLGAGQIASALCSLMAGPDRLRQMSENAMALVDGQGAHRVAGIMLPNWQP
jgi:UDP-2,4-diacetamido-2,4,6-trideoxy-beta-L-altropyranose hydrolase